MVRFLYELDTGMCITSTGTTKKQNCIVESTTGTYVSGTYPDRDSFLKDVGEYIDSKKKKVQAWVQAYEQRQNASNT